LTLDPVVLPDRQSGKPGCFAGVIRNVLSAEECGRLINYTERCGYEQATVTTYGNKQIMASNYRNSQRCIMDSPNVGEVIWSRIHHLIPDPVTASSCVRGEEIGLWSVKGLNHRMRFLKYDPGDFFEMHSDGSYVDGQDKSLLTLMLYLNDCGDGGDFEGGGTTFVCQEARRKGESVRKRRRAHSSLPFSLRNSDVINSFLALVADSRTDSSNVTYKPESGSVLLFSHSLLHQGDEVTAGRKYAARTDVMYTRSVAS